MTSAGRRHVATARTGRRHCYGATPEVSAPASGHAPRWHDTQDRQPVPTRWGLTPQVLGATSTERRHGLGRVASAKELWRVLLKAVRTASSSAGVEHGRERDGDERSQTCKRRSDSASCCSRTQRVRRNACIGCWPRTLGCARCSPGPGAEVLVMPLVATISHCGGSVRLPAAPCGM